MRFFPRTVWAFVESICGFNRKLHVDLARMPMMANNDIGGTSAKNLMHWVQMERADRAQ